jgi:hypothetical protein
MLVLPWPKEAKEIRASYPGKLLLKGFWSPRYLRSEMTTEHFSVFSKFRKRYMLYWLGILAISAFLGVLAIVQMTKENEAFMDRMQEKYIDE